MNCVVQKRTVKSKNKLLQKLKKFEIDLCILISIHTRQTEIRQKNILYAERVQKVQ